MKSIEEACSQYVNASHPSKEDLIRLIIDVIDAKVTDTTASAVPRTVESVRAKAEASDEPAVKYAPKVIVQYWDGNSFWDEMLEGRIRHEYVRMDVHALIEWDNKYMTERIERNKTRIAELEAELRAKPEPPKPVEVPDRVTYDMPTGPKPVEGAPERVTLWWSARTQNQDSLTIMKLRSDDKPVEYIRANYRQ